MLNLHSLIMKYKFENIVIIIIMYIADKYTKDKNILFYCIIF